MKRAAAILGAVVAIGVAYAGSNGVGTGGLQGFPPPTPVNGSTITPAAIWTPYIDAGTIRVNTNLDLQGNDTYITSPGTQASKYLAIACDALSVRIGAQCSGGGAHSLDLYSGSGGNKQWSVDPSGHLVPAGATQKAAITNNSTTCTLDGASPSVCTAAVTASARCVATPISAAALAWGPGVSLSGTTLTVTGANGATNVVNIVCDR